MFRKILFPVPKPSHYSIETHRDNLLWIPPSKEDEEEIPCLFYKPTDERKADFLVIFSHGNACDIGSVHWTSQNLCRRLNIYFLAFEYPAYGISTQKKCNETTINENGLRTYNFVVETLKWPPERIIIFGQSVGTGVACHIAATKKIAGLILWSAYSSIYEVAKHHAGSFLSCVFAYDWWKNSEAIRKVTEPILLIHGTEDRVIPSTNSQILHENSVNARRKHLVLLPGEDHNSISVDKIIQNVEPMVDELRREKRDENFSSAIKIDPSFRKLSPDQESTESSNSSNFFSSWFRSSWS